MQRDGNAASSTEAREPSNQEEAMEKNEANPVDGEHPRPCVSDNQCANDDNRRRAKTLTEPVNTGEEGSSKALHDGLNLSEVQSSLRTMSTGVEELITTVKDFFGLSSDSDSDDTDCDYDSDGERTFSWGKFKDRARARRQRRRHLMNLQLTRVAQRGKVGTGDEARKELNSLQMPGGIILGVRECNFEEFKSRCVGDERKLHCVDVLVAGNSLDDEIKAYKAVVEELKAGGITSWWPDQAPKRIASSNPDPDSETWIRRIRVNSSAVMKVLQRVCHESDDFGRGPMVFYRPFQLLVHRYEDLKAELEKMTRSGDEDTDATGSGSTTLGTGSIPGRAHDTTAVDELACFVEFMETRIMPDALRYRSPSSPEAQSIRYEDLWYLMKPGDLIYVPRNPSSRRYLKSSPSAQSVFRIIVTCLTKTSPKRAPHTLTKALFHTGWSMVCDFIDHNGTSYSSVPLVFPPFLPFRGVKKVTELEMYPVSYLKDGPDVLAQAQSDGAKHVSLVARRFGNYSGWTQTSTALGFPLSKLTGERDRFKSPEHIESDVLVDYQETFHAFPAWKLSFQQDTMEPDSASGSTFTRDDLDNLVWNGTEQTHCEKIDRYLSMDETERIEMKTFLEKKTGPYMSIQGSSLTEQMLALIPRFFFGYAVLERRFVRLDIRCIRKVDQEASDKAFAKLEINPSYKRLILALVKSHFEKIETEKRTHVEIGTQDLIRGKGKGIVILLHGVPGVGKTATAEAVAQKWKKPLFPITCGHLGYTAETLEKSLTEIFRLAHHWGCILLLDEADVFITQRERQDLKRNALVSAFLRVLEYYDGILFLTTNRPGVLDDAVKSRVHLNLHYDHLNEEQTVAIYKQHIQRLKEIEKQRNSDQNERIVILHNEILQFAREHFNQNSEKRGVGRWNGRQIRNAFLIASSLAHYDNEDENEPGEADDLADPTVKVQKQLGRKQFDVVAETTLLYDRYRQSVHSGKSDDHVALEREERATSSQPMTPAPDRLR